MSSFFLAVILMYSGWVIPRSNIQHSSRATSISLPNRGSFLTRQVIITYVLVFAFLFAVSVSLAALTPVYGGLDERAHTTYGLAVVQGEVPFEGRDVEVQSWASSTDDGCYAMDITKSSHCMKPMSDEDTETWASTTASNYPPLYYALIAWPSFFLSGTKAFYAMRFVSALLFSALAALGITALGAARGTPALSVIATTAVTPSSLAIGGFVNPQALEISAAIATAGLLIPLASSTMYNPRARLFVAAATIFLWIQARPVGPVWALIFCTILLLSFSAQSFRVLRISAFWLFFLASILSSSLWLWWRSIAPAELINAGECGLGCSLSHIIYSNDLLHTTATTGALNVHTPPLFQAPYYALILGVFAVALLIANRRRMIALTFGLLAIPAMAAAIQITEGVTGGAMWQGRYALPLSLPLWFLALYLAYDARPVPKYVMRRIAVFATAAYSSCLIPFSLLATARFWTGESLLSFFVVDRSLVPTRANIALIIIAVMCFALVISAFAVQIADAEPEPTSAASPDLPTLESAETSAIDATTVTADNFVTIEHS